MCGSIGLGKDLMSASDNCYQKRLEPNRRIDANSRPGTLDTTVTANGEGAWRVRVVQEIRLNVIGTCDTIAQRKRVDGIKNFCSLAAELSDLVVKTRTPAKEAASEAF